MNEFLTKLGLSEGIIETIKWWLPYIGYLTIFILIVVIAKSLIKKKKGS